jgi:uncharacterized protein (DUF1800 family)/Tol biopolymer transport system component
MTPRHFRRLLVSLAVVAATAPFLSAQATDMPGMLLEAAIQKKGVSGCAAAISDFERLLARFPDERAVVPQALWHLGLCYDGRGDARARQTLERLVRDYPDHRNAQRARTKLASYFDEGADTGGPEVVVREVYPKPDATTGPGNNGGNNPRIVIFSDLAVYDVQKKEVRRLSSGVRSAGYPIISPDGLVAYLSWSGDIRQRVEAQQEGDRAAAAIKPTTELRLVRQNGDGSDDRLLVADATLAWLRPFAWSPDGKQILSAFERNNGTRQIALVDRRDGATQILTSLPWLSPQGMGFSPDGSFIAYEVATPRNSQQQDFYILPVNGNGTVVERRYSLNLAVQRGPTLTEDQLAVHLLNRIAFGPRPGDIDKVKALGVEGYLEQQLYPERIPDPLLEAKLAKYTSLKMDIASLLEKEGPPVAVANRRRATIFERADLAERLPTPPVKEPGDETRVFKAADRPRDYESHSARMLRALYSERQLYELVVDFWMNHFSVNLGDHQLVPDFEEQAIRKNAFGKFEDLLRAVAMHPRMLYYLDNWKSSAPADVVQKRIAARKASSQGDALIALMERLPFLEANKGLNENYARELLELHTLGVDGGYTQQDIIEIARVLTGWTISGKGIPNGREDDGAFFFDALMHVDGDKRVLGQTIAAGGVDEGQTLLKMLAAHPSTARFISTKLARRFIADNPPQAVIDAASRTFQRTGGDIREVLRTLLTSPQFRSPEAYQSKIKKPFELVVSSLRAVNADIGELLDVTGDSRAPLDVTGNRSLLGRMGERIYNYQAPDGNPDVGPAWINSNALLVRLDFANRLATGKYPDIKMNLQSAQRLLEQMGVMRPTQVQIEQTRAMLQAAAAADAAAVAGAAQTSMMMAGGGSGAAAPPAQLDAAAVAVAAMLGSPQFQKR